LPGHHRKGEDLEPKKEFFDYYTDPKTYNVA
jgi:hypothetical protein